MYILAHYILILIARSAKQPNRYEFSCFLFSDCNVMQVGILLVCFYFVHVFDGFFLACVYVCVCVCVFDLWLGNVTFGYCFILPFVHLSVSRGNGTVPDVRLMSTQFLSSMCKQPLQFLL